MSMTQHVGLFWWNQYVVGINWTEAACDEPGGVVFMNYSMCSINSSLKYKPAAVECCCFRQILHWLVRSNLKI